MDVLEQIIQGECIKKGDIGGGIRVADAVGILAEMHVTGAMQLVFNAPVPANACREFRDRLSAQASYVVMGFLGNNSLSDRCFNARDEAGYSRPVGHQGRIEARVKARLPRVVITAAPLAYVAESSWWPWIGRVLGRNRGAQFRLVAFDLQHVVVAAG